MRLGFLSLSESFYDTLHLNAPSQFRLSFKLRLTTEKQNNKKTGRHRVCKIKNILSLLFFV